ncbi:MAG: glycosyltransferase family 2 protein [Acidobacteriota bacterium]
MKQAEEITVIIPTWNRRDLLAHCLRSLRSQTVPAKVLVVDNGSTDGTLAMLEDEFPEMTALPLGRNVGFAGAVNAGLGKVTTSLTALLNNDTEADPAWVERGLEAAERCPEFSIFASRMVDFSDRTHLDSAGDCYGKAGLPTKRGLGEPIDRYPDEEEVFGASAGAAFYRMSMFREIGRFDESYFTYLEDVELNLRARLHGFRCLYLPQAIVYHIEAGSDPGRRSQGTATRPRSGIYTRDRVYWITRNRWQLMVTYQLLQHLPWLTLGWGRSFLFHLLKAGYTADFLRGLAAGVVQTPTAIGKRRRMRRSRTISIRELWRQLRKF